MRQPDTPDGRPLELAAASAATVAATLTAAALFPAPQTVARLVVVAVAVGGCAALVASTRTAVCAACLGYLLFVGFLVNTRGELTWEGASSLWQLLTIWAATGIGLLCRWVRAAQAEAAFDAALQRLLDESEPTEDGRHPR